MRMWLAVDVSRVNGPNLSNDEVRDALEAELPDAVECGSSYYELTVAGTGATVTEAQESIRMRAAR